MYKLPKIERFNQNVLSKYRVYNSVFLTLPFDAIREDDLVKIKQLFLQLGKTPFIKKQKPTPFDEAVSLVWYLEQMSTLHYYAKTNIGSRPSKRKNSDTLNFSELRAIPFLGSWSQLKQNVPGFFGVGSALMHFEVTHQWDKIQTLYDASLFFKTLLENSMMSLAKSFFPLTAYMKDDPQFGDFWQIIYDEFMETKRLLLKIAILQELMENYPDGKASIAMRENIVKPLLTIQQYALSPINQLQKDKHPDVKLIEMYQKIVTRSLFGNTNASRNSA